MHGQQKFLDQIGNYSIGANRNQFPNRICKKLLLYVKKNIKSCTDGIGEWFQDESYFLNSKLVLFPSIKWRFDYILFDRFERYFFF